MIMKYNDVNPGERIFIAVKDNYLSHALKALIEDALIQYGHPVTIVECSHEATVIMTDEPFCLPELAYSVGVKSCNHANAGYVIIYNEKFPDYYEKCNQIISFIDINEPVESYRSAILKIVAIDSADSDKIETLCCSTCIRKNLTYRETDVIILMHLGYSVNQIAAELKCHPKSIYYYQGSVKRKLGLSSKVYFQKYLNTTMVNKKYSLTEMG
ncbi:regulatory LuxR family protein [Serratia fonticola]|jgi:DNA-binding CsgD family transcriptional regulator|uniref:Regulatory LuxR family protein n=1 Tax=Serratia fonticola TaxID=47917 RepID=A0A542D713_SERFO|nr:LuxR C-terminal-related transcriptional regulator [Serratia fonticola]TQI79095.1 regulatory LuxR family protein [Serratia fonticola]TQI98882.1 regulatory LuxR family protein [Serratia fonticola]TVZ68407.1 regulatory LuxR family protein [Serratia fonticola]